MRLCAVPSRDLAELIHEQDIKRDLALASMARDDPPASSMAAAMRGKLGSEFET